MSAGGVVVNVLDCDVVESEFKFHSRYYVRFRFVTFMTSVKASVAAKLGKILRYQNIAKLLTHLNVYSWVNDANCSECKKTPLEANTGTIIIQFLNR